MRRTFVNLSNRMYDGLKYMHNFRNNIQEYIFFAVNPIYFKKIKIILCSMGENR